MTLWLVGYGAWPVPKRASSLVQSLKARDVNRLVDVRLNPCASALDPANTYGPKRWNLQAGESEGIVGLLAEGGIAYEWLVELGNPQRQDHAMRVLKEHLAEPTGIWPVHRGLLRLKAILETPGTVPAILCACEHWETCHRTVVARAMVERHMPGLILRDAKSGAEIPAGDAR